MKEIDREMRKQIVDMVFNEIEKDDNDNAKYKDVTYRGYEFRIGYNETDVLKKYLLSVNLPTIGYILFASFDKMANVFECMNNFTFDDIF